MAKPKDIYKKEKALIPNKIIEELFYLKCTPKQMAQYLEHIKAGSTARATAHASKIVRRWMYYYHDRDRKQNVDQDYQAFSLFERDRVIDEE